MMRKGSLLFIGKMAIGIGLLALLFAKADLRGVAAAVAGANPYWIGAAILVFLIAAAVEVVKFNAACHFRLGGLEAARLVLIGLFFNNFLPSNIGGDAYKVIYFRDQSTGTATALTYVMADRLTGLVALMGLGAFALVLSEPARQVLGASLLWERMDPSRFALVVAVPAIAVLVAAILVLHPGANGRIKSAVARLLADLPDDYVRRSLATSVLVAALFHGLRGVSLWCIASSLGFRVDPFSLAVILAGVALVSMLPLSIGGLGLREGTLAFFLVRAGLSVDSAIAVALINLVLLWGKSLVGGVLFLRARRAGAEHPAPAAS